MTAPEEYLVVVESGYKRGSANYQITVSDVLDRAAAEDLMAQLRAGTSDLLPARTGAAVVDLGPGQFLRVSSRHGATVLDRVTLGPVSRQ